MIPSREVHQLLFDFLGRTWLKFINCLLGMGIVFFIVVLGEGTLWLYHI
jgi:hypothetical protein